MPYTIFSRLYQSHFLVFKHVNPENKILKLSVKRFLFISSTDDSPVKTTNKKKRQRISSSSSEDGDKEEKDSKDAKKLNYSPSKKSYASKLAKFSASPRKEKTVPSNTVDNDVKKEEKDDSEIKNDTKIETSTEKKLSTGADKNEEKSGRTNEKSPSPSKNASLEAAYETQAKVKNIDAKFKKTDKKSPSPSKDKMEPKKEEKKSVKNFFSKLISFFFLNTSYECFYLPFFIFFKSQHHQQENQHQMKASLVAEMMFIIPTTPNITQ